MGDGGVDGDVTPLSYSSPLSDVITVGIASSTSTSVDKGVVDISIKAVGEVVDMSPAVGDEGVVDNERVLLVGSCSPKE
jgi:hypothetical protein